MKRSHFSGNFVVVWLAMVFLPACVAGIQRVCFKQTMSQIYGNITYPYTSGYYPVGTVARYFCYNVFVSQSPIRLLPAGTSTCRTSGWSNQPPRCVCGGFPKPSLGTIEYSSLPLYGQYYPYGTVAQLSRCPTGYYDPPTVRGCTSQGWTGKPLICVRGCTLEHGKAVRLTLTPSKWNWYRFSCDEGYELQGSDLAVCPAKPRCVCQSNRCLSVAGRSLPSFCFCPNNLHKQWKCVNNQWVSVCSGGCPKQSIDEQFGNITYYPKASSEYYPIGTIAKYSCNKYVAGPRQLVVVPAGEAACTERGWSTEAPACYCKDLPHPRMGFINYSSHSSTKHAFGTSAFLTCQPGYRVSFTLRHCTSQGWDGNDFRCDAVATPPPYETTKHSNKEDELVIVSATTGAIIAALIILVVIVSCQRRLHYHRLRRARLRCRQDRDAFAAYITYHRNVGMTLPSYDEAVNECHNGEPPTFDEATANDNREPAEVTLVAVRTPSDDDDASVTDEGRFVRAVRALFGGRAFTTRGVYCHLVPSERNVNENESVENEAERVETESSQSSVDERDEVNELLTRAGMC